MLVARVVVVTALSFAPTVAASASASPASRAPTGGQRTHLQLARGSAAEVTAARSTGGDLLPLTGVDLAFAVLVGGCLVLLGAGLSRLSARRPRD